MLPFPVMLPFSPLQRFALIAGEWPIFALRGSWPPKGKASSPPWDPVFHKLSFSFPTLALRLPLQSNKQSWYLNMIAVFSSLFHSSFFLSVPVRVWHSSPPCRHSTSDHNSDVGTCTPQYHSHCWMSDIKTSTLLCRFLFNVRAI